MLLYSHESFALRSFASISVAIEYLKMILKVIKILQQVNLTSCIFHNLLLAQPLLCRLFILCLINILAFPLSIVQETTRRDDINKSLS